MITAALPLAGMAIMETPNGVFINGSDGNTIRGNTLCDPLWSQGSAICVQDAELNTIIRNTVSQHMCTGICMISAGLHNDIYLNCLYGNLGLTSGQPNACDGESQNLWHSPRELTCIYNSVEYTGFLGNYYGDYSGTDDGSAGRTAGDGEGDTAPYSFMGGIDPYPLTDRSVDAYQLPGDEAPATPPSAGFAASATWGIAPFTTAFASESQGSDITSSLWDFGDGNSSNFENPSHTYQTPGVYTVSLTVANSAGGLSITRERYILVIDQLTWAALLGETVAGEETPEGIPVTVPSTENTSTNRAIFVERLSANHPSAAAPSLLVLVSDPGNPDAPDGVICRFGGTVFSVEDTESGKSPQISIEYTNADLAAADGNPIRLALSYCDETRGEWVMMHTALDVSTRTLSATCSHFGNGRSWPGRMRGWRVIRARCGSMPSPGAAGMAILAVVALWTRPKQAAQLGHNTSDSLTAVASLTPCPRAPARLKCRAPSGAGGHGGSPVAASRSWLNRWG